jgi:hypothetical protein
MNFGLAVLLIVIAGFVVSVVNVFVMIYQKLGAHRKR